MGEEKIHSLYLHPKDTSSQFRAPTRTSLVHRYLSLERHSYIATRTSLVHRYLSLVRHSYIATCRLYIATCDSYIATCNHGLHINPNKQSAIKVKFAVAFWRCGVPAWYAVLTRSSGTSAYTGSIF
jgi:hypothetical protein